MIDRAPQNLPVPLGGAAPVRVLRPRRRHLARRHVRGTGVVLAVVASVAGVALLFLPNPVDAYVDGAGIHVGAMTLRATGPSVGGRTTYSGDASLVLVEAGGTARAAASWRAGGRTMLGTCTLRTEGRHLVDECEFDTASGRLTSVDVLDPSSSSSWHRTYNDGVSVDIGVAPDGAAIPIPFPVGR